MEAESNCDAEKSNFKLIELIREYKMGNRQGMEKIICLFYADMCHLTNYVRIPHEEALQALTLELIEAINKINLPGG